jgi:hypothetical protein
MYSRASVCVYHRVAQRDDDGPSVAADFCPGRWISEIHAICSG